MTIANEQQIADWNGPMGRQWAALQSELDRIVAPFGATALRAAAVQAGEHVIDVGCGCGDTSMEPAGLVGTQGAVRGVDVSQPMLEVARSRAQRAGLANVQFAEGDASVGGMPGAQHLLYSRFGVMFFEKPEAAFAHMRKALRPGGRLAFVCWRTPRDNPWAMAPLVAARKAMGVTSARFIKEVGAEHLQKMQQAIETSRAAVAAPDGSVSLQGSTWIVTGASQT